ncbi:MAG: hypothetical protein [Wendovervirus sonii]|uniref:Uncharacterized protein n=1 Tax=phage Lak_Megaphage_Sonny TaxID=3109229 RepID=A0ABZ0Z684_9CAUD|nr:MAG: hypothetical protein [phage Lak_Megaphage_Sonny]
MQTLIINTQSEKDERIIWCENNISTETNNLQYEILNGKLIIHGNIIIPDGIGELGVKIDEVYGNIYLENTLTNTKGYFTSLKNFPDVVHGSVNISMNPNIKSFKGCPRKIEGFFKCNACGFTSTDYISEYIGGKLILYNNPINDIKNLTKIYVNGMIDIDFIKVRPTDETYKKLLENHKIKACTDSWV